MLCELSIKNFAIIDDLNIRFSQGLTILSGETGAGKSILINAVNLLLGSRASSRLVRTGADSAELEAYFDISDSSPAFQKMKECGYDPTEGLLVKRIITSTDRHRIYINGSLATVQLLTGITENMASISGQHAHQNLLKEENHLLILDQYGKLMPLRERVRSHFQRLQPLIRHLKDLEASRQHQADQLALLEFQKQEILAADIREGEDEALEAERLRLKHGEFLFQTVNTAVDALYGRDGAVFESLSEMKRQMEKAVAIDPALADSAADLDDVVYRIEDIAESFRQYTENIELDPTRLEDVEERLDLLTRLKRKYGGTKGSLGDILARYAEICSRLKQVENLSESIDDAKRALAECHQEVSELAMELSEKREKAAGTFAGRVEKALALLEMPHTQFRVQLTGNRCEKKTADCLQVDNRLLSETGVDTAMFMIAPNMGEEIKPLAAIASGGELSRVVLALKAMLAENDSLETIVFDEVDAGIGGGVAETVGQKIAELARFHQIICITHLPQIAKFGDHHYKIEKKIIDGRTISHISPLTPEERVEEMARMLGGVEITETTRAHAREMLNALVVVI